jgi:hypothetical protein
MANFQEVQAFWDLVLDDCLVLGNWFLVICVWVFRVSGFPAILRSLRKH